MCICNTARAPLRAERGRGEGTCVPSPTPPERPGRRRFPARGYVLFGKPGAPREAEWRRCAHTRRRCSYTLPGQGTCEQLPGGVAYCVYTAASESGEGGKGIPMGPLPAWGTDRLDMGIPAGLVARSRLLLDEPPKVRAIAASASRER
jgi:hypothetical protein